MLTHRERLGVALLVFLTVSCVPLSAMAQNKGKGKETDPVVTVTPVKYEVSTVVEVAGFQGPIDINDFGIAICTVDKASVSVPIATQSETAMALIDIHTGGVTYVENLLTSGTVWTQLPEGADAVYTVRERINNRGTIAVTAYSVVEGVDQVPNSYLLHPVVTGATPEGDEVLGYQPEHLGIGQVLFLNDLNWVVGQDLSGWFIRKHDGVRIYLDTIGLAHLPGALFDLNNQGLFNGTTLHSDRVNEDPYTYDVLTNQISYYDGVYCKDIGRTLNDHGVIAGEHFIYYEYTKRGKTQTGIRKVPAIIDPVGGLQLFDDPNNGQVQDRVVYINHQRKNNQSTLLAYTPKAMDGETLWDAVRDLWLKLPNHNGFHLYEAMDAQSKLTWSGFNINYDQVKILTPRAEDLTVNNDVAPTICGMSYDGRHTLWVCKPVPATP